MNDAGFEPNGDSEEDRRLAALLSATRAPANPAVWRRVRAELEAAGVRSRPERARGFDAVLAWFTRPAALAAATAALVVSLGAGWRWFETIEATSMTSEAVAYDVSGTLIESLLDENAAVPAGLEESGDAPTDSGGRS